MVELQIIEELKVVGLYRVLVSVSPWYSLRYMSILSILFEGCTIAFELPVAIKRLHTCGYVHCTMLAYAVALCLQVVVRTQHGTTPINTCTCTNRPINFNLPFRKLMAMLCSGALQQLWNFNYTLSASVELSEVQPVHCTV